MATFGLRYFAQLRSKYKGVFWRVEIAELGYSGPSKKMEFAGQIFQSGGFLHIRRAVLHF